MMFHMAQKEADCRLRFLPFVLYEAGGIFLRKSMSKNNIDNMSECAYNKYADTVSVH